MKLRTRFYIDGFNLYYGIKDAKRKDLLWINVQNLAESLMWDNEELDKIFFFTAKPNIRNDRKKFNRHVLFMNVARETCQKLEFIEGKYYKKPTKCKLCNGAYMRFEEKQTDVKMALQIYDDVIRQRVDVVYLLSADSDMIPAVEFVRRWNPSLIIKVLFPPERESGELQQLVSGSRKLYPDYVEKFILPDPVKLPSGASVPKPSGWVRTDR
jgi:uncharacterized LabA/DUF88 family protein